MKALLEITLNDSRVSGNAEARRLVHSVIIAAANVAIDKVNKKFREELGAEYIIFDKMKFVEFPLDKTGVINRGVERWHTTSEK